jgi:hypothetical protein
MEPAKEKVFTMKKIACATIALFAMICFADRSNAQIDLQETLDRVLSGEKTTGPSSSRLVARGLKEALSIGIQNAIDRLGKPGGYLNNNRVRITVPENLKLVETTLRSVGQGERVDQFIAAMNRAASDAVPAGTRIFMNAAKSITIQDAVALLNGPDDAATTYFRQRTQRALTSAFLPIVRRSMESARVIGYYNALNNAYKAYGKPLMENEEVRALASILTGESADESAGAPEADLDAYVTREALDGLFLMIAREEKKIREQPAARVTDLLEKVFGSSVR